VAETPQGMALTIRADARKLRAAGRPALVAVGVYLVSKVHQCFRESRDPWGRPWAPLRSRRGKPLLNTGLFLASFTYAVAGNAVRVVSGFPWAAVHLRGATIRVPEMRRPHPMKPWMFPGRDGRLVFTRRIRAHTKVIPARPMVGWSPQWVAGADAAVRAVLDRAVGAT
jgi:phage gpG-like protein